MLTMLQAMLEQFAFEIFRCEGKMQLAQEALGLSEEELIGPLLRPL